MLIKGNSLKYIVRGISPIYLIIKALGYTEIILNELVILRNSKIVASAVTK